MRLLSAFTRGKTKMNCCIEAEKSYTVPVLAGTTRFLTGVAVFFAGLYLAAFSDVQGHGLGLLLIFGSPFVILKDGE